MSRQTERAEARHAAKANAANEEVAARTATRSKKGLKPLSPLQAAGYPSSRYVPVEASGKRYPFSNTRQHARYVRAAQ